MAVFLAWVRRVILGFLVVWLGHAAGLETFKALDRAWLHPPAETPPGRWRFATPPPERLNWWLEQVREVVPEGSRLAFSSPATRGNAVLYRAWWATYWMPQYTLLPAPPGVLKPGVQPVDFYVTYGLRLDDPRLELVHEEWAGAVYRERAAP